MIEPLASVLALDLLIFAGLAGAAWNAVRPRVELRGVRPWTR